MTYYRYSLLLLLAVSISCCNQNNHQGDNTDSNVMPETIDPIITQVGQGTIMHIGNPIEKSFDYFRLDKSHSLSTGCVIRYMIVSSDGTIWFSYKTYQFSDSGAHNDEIYKYHEMEDGIGHYDGTKIMVYNKENGFPDTLIDCMAQDKLGNIWLGGIGSGLMCFDGKNFISYTTAQGLHSNTIRSICADTRNHIWFSSWPHRGIGLNYFDGKTISYYNGIGANEIIVDSSGKAWLLLLQGLSSFSDNKFTYYPETIHYLQGPLTQMQEDKLGNIWLGNSHGDIIKYNGTKFTFYTASQVKNNNKITSIFADKNNNVWFGTIGGLILFKNDSFNIVLSDSLSKTHTSIECMIQLKDGSMLVGTKRDGIYRFDGKNFMPL